MSANDFGICWGLPEAAGMERAIGQLNPAERVRYLELGCAEGRTFAAVLTRLARAGLGYYGYAVDKPGGWSFTVTGFLQNLAAFNPGIDYQLYTCGGRVFMNSLDDGHLSLALIDACHEQGCCREDFLMVAPKMKPGGLVVFHDTAVYAQGKDIQPHQGQPIGVRAALEELGLLTGVRPGWGLVEEVPGEEGRDERGIVVVRKDPCVDG